MSYRETSGYRRLSAEAANEQARAILAEQLVAEAAAAAQRAAAQREYQELVAEGRRTPIERVYDTEDVMDIRAFLQDMAANGNRGSVTFTPPKMGIKNVTRFVISGAAPVFDNGNGVQAKWPVSRGFVAGTFKPVPSNWTTGGELPELAVIFTDGTVGRAASMTTSSGRIVVNPNVQPQPLIPLEDGSYEQPQHGFYAHIIPNVLGENVEIPEDVAAILPETRAGAPFMYSELGDALHAIARDGHVAMDAIQVVAPTLHLNGAAPAHN